MQLNPIMMCSTWWCTSIGKSKYSRTCRGIKIKLTCINWYFRYKSFKHSKNWILTSIDKLLTLNVWTKINQWITNISPETFFMASACKNIRNSWFQEKKRSNLIGCSKSRRGAWISETQLKWIEIEGKRRISENYEISRDECAHGDRGIDFNIQRGKIGSRDLMKGRKTGQPRKKEVEAASMTA